MAILPFPSFPSARYTQKKLNEVKLEINAFMADGPKGIILPVCIRSMTDARLCISRPFKNPAYVDEETTPHVHPVNFSPIRSVHRETKSRIYTHHLDKAQSFLERYFKERAAYFESRADAFIAKSAEAYSIQPQSI